MKVSVKSFALAAVLLFGVGVFANSASALETGGGTSVGLCYGSGVHCATVKKGNRIIKFVKKDGTPDIQQVQ